MHAPTRYTWQHGDDPHSTTTAEVTFLDDGLVAHGEQRASSYQARWSLSAEQNWVTRTLEVEVEGRGWGRSLRLERHPEGRWSATTTLSGEAPHLAPPGIDDPEALGGALDCDLGLCPLTNTMPIRRLGRV